MALFDTYTQYQNSRLSGLTPTSTFAGKQVSLEGAKSTGGSGGFGMGYAGIIAQVIGAGAQAYGTIQQGYDAAMGFGINAQIARANAAAEKFMNEFDVARMRKTKKKFRGTQRSLYAGAGVRLQGSPIDVMIDTAAELETDILINQYKSKIQQIEFEKQAKIADIYKRSAPKKAWAQGVGSLLSSTVGSLGLLGGK